MKYSQAISLWQNGLLKKVPSSKYFEVKQPFYWYVDYSNKKEIITVYEWFCTDFWSIPKPLRIFFNPSRYIWYILHDYLYSKSWTIYETTHTWFEISYTRKDADLILLETLHLEWASFIERWLIYIWVRCCWGLFFKRK